VNIFFGGRNPTLVVSMGHGAKFYTKLRGLRKGGKAALKPSLFHNLRAFRYVFRQFT